MGDPKNASIFPLAYMPQVKVYRATMKGRWNLQGVGHVSMENLERPKDVGLIVIDEEENNTILVHRISCNCLYEKEGNTIAWKDPDLAIELAVDFLGASACSSIWENIKKVQNDITNRQGIELREIDSSPAKGPQEATTAQSRVGTKVYSRQGKGSRKAATTLSSGDEPVPSENDEIRKLPPLELSTLPLILETILDGDDLDAPELLLQDPEFFRKLVNLFRACEESQNMDGLHMIFKLVQLSILLNSQEIFDRILSDEFILDIIGTLEYDPNVTQVQQHRTFLKEKVAFKEAIHIENAEVLSKIHQSYRIGYLKDVILPTILDEDTKATLETIQKTNNAFVISLLKDNTSFFQELVNKMRSNNTSAESKKDLVLFLHEFCSHSKFLSLMEQVNLLRDLAEKGIFDITADVLRSRNKILASTGTKILFCFLDTVPSTLRSYVIQQNDNTFLRLLVNGLITGLGCDIHGDALDIFQRLVDSREMPIEQQKKIVQIFCEEILDDLMDIIELCCPPKNDSHRAESDAPYKPESLLNICELLRFCVIHHFRLIYSYFYVMDVIKKVLYLTRRKETFLAVAAVRFFRATIFRGANEECFLQHIVHHNLLKPVIDAFTERRNRDNMLQSAVLELLDYIRKEDIKVLFACLVDRFWVQLVKFEHLGAVRALLDKHDQVESLPIIRSNILQVQSSPKSEIKDNCDTKGLLENIHKSDEDNDATSELHEQDQTAETSKPGATEVNEKAGSAGNADSDNRNYDNGHCSPQAKRTKPPADDEDHSSSSAANHKTKWGGRRRKRRKSF